MENRGNAFFKTHKEYGLLKILRGFIREIEFSESFIQPLQPFILNKTARQIKERYKISRFHRGPP